jgi:hypothetical protein
MCFFIFSSSSHVVAYWALFLLPPPCAFINAARSENVSGAVRQTHGRATFLQLWVRIMQPNDSVRLKPKAVP